MRTPLQPYVLLVALMTTLTAWTQPDGLPPLPEERMREIKAQRTAYLTTKLGLTPEEAQTFWPIYNAYDDGREANRKEMRRTMNPRDAGPEELTEAQAAERLNKGLELRQRELDLERSYKDRFVKAIGARKTVALIRAEHDFNREVLRRLRERMDERREGGGPPPRKR
jgi:hypothetical protein